MYRTRFLVDTDIIINYLKGGENARNFLMRIIDESVLGFFSVITEAEYKRTLSSCDSVSVR
jgi:predicted nucleic acid-binding protein